MAMCLDLVGPHGSEAQRPFPWLKPKKTESRTLPVTFDVDMGKVSHVIIFEQQAPSRFVVGRKKRRKKAKKDRDGCCFQRKDYKAILSRESDLCVLL